MVDLDPYTLVLAQNDGAVGLPGDTSTPVQSSTGDGGNGQPAPVSPFGGTGMLLILGFVGIFLLMSILAPRKERKKREAMLSSIKKHDRVQTIGGVIGTIVELKPDSVVLKVDESANTRITFARTAVQQVITAGAAGDDGQGN